MNKVRRRFIKGSPQKRIERDAQSALGAVKDSNLPAAASGQEPHLQAGQALLHLASFIAFCISTFSLGAVLLWKIAGLLAQMETWIWLMVVRHLRF